MLYESNTELLICPNCGTKFNEAPTSGMESKERQVASLCCPVCHFDLMEPSPSKVAALPKSSSDLEAMVHDLLMHARTGGVNPADIVQVLRDELEFAVELAQTGRRYSVQIIDLGSDEQNLGIPSAPYNNRDLINSRNFDQ